MPVKILMLNALTERSGSGVRFWSISKELARQGYSLFFLERSIGKNGRRGEPGQSTKVAFHVEACHLDTRALTQAGHSSFF